MTLNDFITNLTNLQSSGHGELPVYYYHGCSGVTEELSYAHVATATKDGPYDLPLDTEYVCVYAGK